MTRGVAHPSELRAEVVAAVLAGMTVAQAARAYGLSKQTVSRWAGTNGTDNARDRDEEIRELILDLITNHVTAIEAQLQAASRPDWLEKQSAAELAELVAVERDTAIRLLAGVFRPADDEPSHALDSPGTSSSA